MKAIVKTHFPILKGIFDVDDVVEIEPILSTYREVLSTKKVHYTRQNSLGLDYTGYVIKDDVVREKGSYLDFRIKSKNGHYYTGHCFHNAIGYKTLSEIFQKA